MTIYFVSRTPAALRLNGTYVGIIDGVARRMEWDGTAMFAEATPADNRLPLNFMIDGGFFARPPCFAEVLLMGGDALVRLKGYARKPCPLRALAQERFCGGLITLFCQGEVGLSIDRSDGTYAVHTLDDGFESATLRASEIGGHPVMCVAADGRLAIVSAQGSLVFCNRVKSYSLGDMLGVTVQFESCAGAVGECMYAFDGQQLKLTSGRTVETRPVQDEVKHFAFFESVLTRGNAADYLDGGLKDRAGELSGYLGEFVDVLVPPQAFYERTGERTAAGLAYAAGKNLFTVKFYAADMRGGKVCNIREVNY